MDAPMRFGIFLAPFHPVGQNPTLALERDLELVVRLDQLGYDEAWIGEHHSAGFEIIASPEVFIAVLAERTRHIRLGTGVSSLPYHHPLILTDRMVLLDHLTRGRMMMGVGPGALPSDAFMMGIDPMAQRQMMEESLEAILALLDGSEPRDHATPGGSRFAMRGRSCVPTPTRASRSPSPHRSHPPDPVRRDGSGCRCFRSVRRQREDSTCSGATGRSWRSARAEFGTTVDRRKWRLVGPMHLAETEKQARADVEFGLAQWIDYFEHVAALPLAPQTLHVEEMVDAINNTGFAVVGTPEMAIAQTREAPGPVRRVRDLLVDGARVGRPRSDAAFVRAVRSRGHAEVPGIARLTRLFARLGCGEPAHLHRRGGRRRHAGDPGPPPGESGQATAREVGDLPPTSLPSAASGRLRSARAVELPGPRRPCGPGSHAEHRGRARCRLRTRRLQRFSRKPERALRGSGGSRSRSARS